jgi:hypothetical protein
MEQSWPDSHQCPLHPVPSGFLRPSLQVSTALVPHDYLLDTGRDGILALCVRQNLALYLALVYPVDDAVVDRSSLVPASFYPSPCLCLCPCSCPVDEAARAVDLSCARFILSLAIINSCRLHVKYQLHHSPPPPAPPPRRFLMAGSSSPQLTVPSTS